jgi:hypothetical protein
MNRILCRIIIIATLTVFVANGQAGAQSHSTGEFDPEKREQWIAETIKVLKDFKPRDTDERSGLKVRDNDGQLHQSFRIVKKGMLEFDSGEWAYIILHSSHDNDSIGDFALAVDQKGRIYKHEGHVCGGICHYEALAPEKYTRSRDFFKYFRDDTDGLPWKKL